MYTLDLVAVLVLVYIAPAVALCPSLALKPERAIAIPFLSVAVVVSMQALLSVSGLFAAWAVQSISAALVLASLARLYRARCRTQGNSEWRGFPCLYVLLNLALVLYFGASIFLHGFVSHDEIYSWNMWAIQHFQGADIDFYYTQAPYPQLFPRMLSWAYMLINDIESQTAVKTALAVFPFIIYSIWALAPRRYSGLHVVLHVALAVFVVREVGLKKIFDDGMPDTMAAAAILASIYFIQIYRQNRSRTNYFWLSLLCACVGVYSKQPALVWAMFSFPSILAIDILRNMDRPRRLLLGLIPATSAVVWMLTAGRNFQDNQGVLNRSFADRDLLDQVLWSIDLYIIQEPMVALLAVLAIVSVFRSRMGIEILLLFVLPSMASWFLFANYDLRAGVPSLVTLAYLVAHGRYCMGKAAVPAGPLRLGKAIWGMGIILMLLSVNNFFSDILKHRRITEGYKVGDAFKNNLYTMFGADAPLVKGEVVGNKNSVLWTPSNYVYGIFYGHISVLESTEFSSLY